MKQKISRGPFPKKKTVALPSDSETLARLMNILSNKPRDLLLLTLATSTGLKLKELLRLKVKDLNGLKAGDRISPNWLDVNYPWSPLVTEDIYQKFQDYMQKFQPGLDDHLFKSRKGSKPLNLTSASSLIKKWFEIANFESLAGARSLRKMWKSLSKSLLKKDEVLNKEGNSKKTFNPLKSISLQGMVYNELLQAIVTGQIQPGERLVADTIARQMNISRVPVREALQRLEAIGIISSQARRGIVVNELSLDNLKEILRIRLLLESEAAEVAAQCHTEETLNRLEIAHQKFKLYGINPDDRLHWNKEFHYIIYRAANMPILQLLIDWLWDRLAPYRHMILRETGEANPTKVISYHEGMLEGMKRRDPKEVSKWVKADILNALRILDFVILSNEKALRKSPPGDLKKLY